MPTIQQKTSTAYNKVSRRVAEVGTTANFPFFVSPSSPNVIFGSNIILNDRNIPENAPTLNLVNGNKFNSDGDLVTDDSGVIMYNEGVMNSIDGSLNASYALESFEGLIIPFNYSDGSYRQTFTANSLSGEEIPFGLNDFLFFNEAGIITFFNGRPAPVTLGIIGIKYWTYIGDTASNLEPGTPIVTQIYDLDTTSIPINTTWSSSNERWTIDHNLNSDNIVTKLSIDSNVTPASFTKISNNQLTINILGNRDKSNGNIIYPDNVTLTINKLGNDI